MTDKITIDRAVVEQALEALDADPSRNLWAVARDRRRAIAALRSALSEEALQRLTDIHQEMEQPQQEPVAWMCTETKVLYDHDTSDVDKYHGFKPTVPLYTAPPAPRTEQPQQEPVAYVDGDEAHRRILWEPSQAAFDLAVGTKLYTHPAPRTEKPRLTDGEISWLWSVSHNDTTDRMPHQVFARAIEDHIRGKA